MGHGQHLNLKWIWIGSLMICIKTCEIIDSHIVIFRLSQQFNTFFRTECTLWIIEMREKLRQILRCWLPEPTIPLGYLLRGSLAALSRIDYSGLWGVNGDPFWACRMAKGSLSCSRLKWRAFSHLNEKSRCWWFRSSCPYLQRDWVTAPLGVWRHKAKAALPTDYWHHNFWA